MRTPPGQRRQSRGTQNCGTDCARVRTQCQAPDRRRPLTGKRAAGLCMRCHGALRNKAICQAPGIRV
jgi:hypothetical protein